MRVIMKNAKALFFSVARTPNFDCCHRCHDHVLEKDGTILMLLWEILMMEGSWIEPGEVLVPQPLRLAVAVLEDEVGGVHYHTQAPVKCQQEGLAVVHAPLGRQPRCMDRPWPPSCHLLHP